MRAGYQFVIENDLFVIRDFSLNISNNLLDVADDHKFTVWANPAHLTALNLDEIKNGFVVFRDTSNTKNKWTLDFRDPNDLNKVVFENYTSDCFNRGNNLKELINGSLELFGVSRVRSI